jgi:hypothetical protein
MNIFGVEWPDCASRGCGNPGFFRILIDGDRGKFWAHLCIFCIGEIRECLLVLAEAAREEQALLEQLEPPELEKLSSEKPPEITV